MNIKIIVCAINFACLLVSLAFPNDVTPLTIIPPLLTSCEWLFMAKGRTIWYTILLSASSILGIVCIFLGLTSNIIEDPQIQSSYSIVFKPNVAALGNMKIPYNGTFICVVLILFLCLSLSELISSWFTKRTNNFDANNFDAEILEDIKEC